MFNNTQTTLFCIIYKEAQAAQQSEIIFQNI